MTRTVGYYEKVRKEQGKNVNKIRKDTQEEKNEKRNKVVRCHGLPQRSEPKWLSKRLGI